MAVTDQTPIGGAVGNGVTTIYPFDYYVGEAADLVVQIDGVGKTLNVDYTVTGAGNQEGGQIVFLVPPAAGTQVTHFRDTGLERSIDYQTTGDLLANVLDFDIDRIWLALQEIFSGGKGAPTALRVPPGEVVPPLPKSADRADRLVGFDSNGKPIAVLPSAGDATALALDLANSVSASKGPGQIGFNGALNYAVGTIGWAEKLFTVDVRWFGPANGALFNGVTDDTAAWLAALATLPAGGGRVVFGRGKSKISRLDILNKSNVWIEGEPGFSGSYNSTDFGSTIVSTNSTGPALYFQNGVGCGVRGVQIKGAGTAIQYDSCLGFRVEQCNLRENGIGIQAFGNGVGLILNNMIRDNTVAGIRLTQSSGDTIVTGNDIGASGINVHVCTGNCHIVQNHIFSSKTGGSGRGVLVDATFLSADSVIRHCEISGNLIANNDMQIEVKGTSLADRDIRDVHIHTNHIHQADDGGEGFDPSFPYGQGVLLQNANRVNVHHNNFIGLRDYAIKAVNCLGGVYIERNTIRSGNAAGVIFDLVQQGRIERNEFQGNGGTAVVMSCTTGGNFTQNNHVAGNTFSANVAVYSEDANTRSNFIYDNLGGILSDYALSATAPISQLRHIGMAGNTETINQNLVFSGSAWNGPRLILGTNQFWVDGSGRLRVKGSAPTSDTDGTVVGTQS